MAINSAAVSGKLTVNLQPRIKDNKLKIIIEGYQKEGKSTLANEIAWLLKNIGVNFTYEDLGEGKTPSIDYKEHRQNILGIMQSAERKPIQIITSK